VEGVHQVGRQEESVPVRRVVDVNERLPAVRLTGNVRDPES
jgi:hypothetical protein